jgi:hypothetical protein
LKVEQINTAKEVVLIKPQVAYRDLTEPSVERAAALAVNTLQTRSVANALTPPNSKNCDPQLSPITTKSEEQYTESDVVEPFREVNQSELVGKSCGGGEVYTVCKRDNKIEAFQIINGGPNNIVKTNEYYINRTMSFEFEDKARSDLKLVVSDAPDDFTSHATYSVMLFFPRSVLPAIKKVGDELIVTLPNREIVRYNAKTKEVIGGVFEEKPIAQDTRKKALPPGIKYAGNGVMIRADKSGDLPYGDIELPNGKPAPSITIATVSKKGFKDCKIPSKDIWYTRHDRAGNTFIKPELANDQGMDKFIKERCGFSLF